MRLGLTAPSESPQGPPSLYVVDVDAGRRGKFGSFGGKEKSPVEMLMRTRLNWQRKDFDPRNEDGERVESIQNTIQLLTKMEISCPVLSFHLMESLLLEVSSFYELFNSSFLLRSISLV